MGQGNPDQPTPDYIVKAMQNATAKPADHKYSLFRGELRFKEAIAQFYQDEYGVTIDPYTEVAILAGSKIGLVELPWALMNPGELLLLPNPGYPDYLSGAALGRVKYESVTLKRENDFLIDYHDIDDKTAEKAKFLYLNYPNNPTGRLQLPSFIMIRSLLLKKSKLVLYQTLPMALLDLTVKNHCHFYKQKALNQWELRHILFQKPLIWLVGVLGLRLVMLR